jgi:hypothetical protein
MAAVIMTTTSGGMQVGLLVHSEMWRTVMISVINNYLCFLKCVY